MYDCTDSAAGGSVRKAFLVNPHRMATVGAKTAGCAVTLNADDSYEDRIILHIVSQSLQLLITVT